MQGAWVPFLVRLLGHKTETGNFQKEYCNKFSEDLKQIAGVESLSPGLGVRSFGFAYGRCCVNLGRSCEFLRFLGL